ncbi:MAG: cbb3-type cytochrome oxidase subunit 3 [Candidatus Reddybacter sp.]
MDQGTWEGIGTLLAMVAFIAVCVWAYSGRNKARFDEAAMLPFADELQAEPSVEVTKPLVTDSEKVAAETVSQETTNKVGNGI